MLLLVVTGAWVWARVTTDPPDPSTTTETFLTSDPSSGLETAPITIVEYGDLGCPACWAWDQLGVPNQIRAKYGDQVRFVWKNFPVITLQSPKAAEAAQCAYEQGKFWEFHDAIFTETDLLPIGKDDLRVYAANIGLDMDKFGECVESRRYRDKVNGQQHEAFEYGFKGAPAFLVNDVPIIGPQRFEVFEKVIDSILKK